MLISEFIDRTGFRPTEDYYHTVIEPEYNNSNLDKDAWCKQWKAGSIQKAYDAMSKQANDEYARVLDLEAKVKALREEWMGLCDENRLLKEENQALHNDRQQGIDERTAMAYTLLEISEAYSSAELREIVINEIGFKNYIAYIQSWLKALKNDNKMIVWAASRAEKAAKYIMNIKD